MRRNIGIVTTWFERGAAYVSRQFKDLLVQEHNVFIYARGGEKSGKDDPTWNVGNVYWGKRNAWEVSSRIVKKDFLYWIESNGIEIVFFNEQQVWNPIAWCHDLGVCTGAYIDYYTKETVPLFSAYDFLICNTQRHYSVFKNHSQCYFVPWGTDIELFKPKEISLKSEEKVIFFHSAGMNPLRKGTDLFLRALSKAGSANAKGLIHTQVDLMQFFPELSGIIQPMVKEGRLELINKTEPAPGLYHLGDVYVYPSRLEGIGLTIAEALSVGLPVITTNVQPMNEFVHENQTGLLVEVEREELRGDKYYWAQSICSIDSLAKALNYFMKNPDEIKRMASEARHYAEDHLNWKVNAPLIAEIFNGVETKEGRVKESAVAKCLDFEKQRSIRYYLNTYKPYVSLKRRVKGMMC